MPQDRYQTVQELAQRLEVAEATVRHWIKSGELRAIDIGKGWRIADTDLQRFLRARETTRRETVSIASNGSTDSPSREGTCGHGYTAR